METGTLDLLDAVGARVLVGGDDLLHLLGRDGEALGGGPDAVALVVEDGGLVEVAGADEAGLVVLVFVLGFSFCFGGGGVGYCLGVPVSSTGKCGWGGTGWEVDERVNRSMEEERKEGGRDSYL